ncbi:type VI secretion-associated protein [Escherichia coli]|uniref:Type VI secretion-associated protein n=1 Tax=Escherichia coli TaxID=562 RepID=A0A376X608_ECOLX|nr:type VI secretion-associated protein [Escherichia coli]
MSRLRVFRQTGWFIAGLMTGLPATAAPAEASSMAGVAVAVATTTPPDATATLQAIQSCRRESAALERLDCYDRLLAPLSPSGFDGALVKAGFVGEAWTRATEQEKTPRGQHHRTAGDAGAGGAPDGGDNHPGYRSCSATPGADVQLRGQYHPDAGGADAPSGCP